MQEGRDRARFQATLTNRRKREEREQEIKKIAFREFKKYVKENFFAFGLALYWAEGSKKTRRFQFMNSDYRLVKAMVRWVEKYLKIPKNELQIRLYIHKPYSDENCEYFWSKVVGVPQDKFSKTIYKPTPHTIKKNRDYKGCIRIEVRKVLPWLKVMNWQEFYKTSMRL